MLGAITTEYKRLTNFFTVNPGTGPSKNIRDGIMMGFCKTIQKCTQLQKISDLCKYSVNKKIKPRIRDRITCTRVFSTAISFARVLKNIQLNYENAPTHKMENFARLVTAQKTLYVLIYV